MSAISQLLEKLVHKFGSPCEILGQCFISQSSEARFPFRG